MYVKMSTLLGSGHFIDLITCSSFSQPPRMLLLCIYFMSSTCTVLYMCMSLFLLFLCQSVSYCSDFECYYFIIVSQACQFEVSHETLIESLMLHVLCVHSV